MMKVNIYDKALGMLQFSGKAETPEAAWKAFRKSIGYSNDEPGICESSAYVWTDKDQINDITECRDFS